MSESKPSLLIIGAGGHGHVVAEIAYALGYSVSFLDDKSPEAVGTISEMQKYINQYDALFIAIGNNALRKQLTEKAAASDIRPVTLIHPSAYISMSATIGEGTVIAPHAVVHTNCSIGKGCILSVGAIVDHDAVVEPFVHMDAGSICKSGGRIETGRKLGAGEVVLGY